MNYTALLETYIHGCLSFVYLSDKWFTGKWGGVFDREFTKTSIIRDFDDVLTNPFRYVHLFLLHTLSSKKFSENRHA